MDKKPAKPPPNIFLEPPRLSVLSDETISTDDLGADHFDLGLRVGPIYDIVRHPDTRTPMTIAIYGDWGAGKTSAMKWLEGHLGRWNKHSRAKKGITVRTAWFYPWKYQTREDVWRGLVAEVIIACLGAETTSSKALLAAGGIVRANRLEPGGVIP